MIINVDNFRSAAGLSADTASRWLPHFQSSLNEFCISSPVEIAMFIAQVGHESGGFSRVVESLNYTPAALLATFGSKRITQYQADMLGRTPAHPANQSSIANLVYANRMGNSLPGDGWKFRGRGLIQITGLNNYRACGSGLKLDLIASPQLLELDDNAMRSAAWFWKSNQLGKYSDDVDKVTRIINGGANGLADRSSRFRAAMAVLS